MRIRFCLQNINKADKEALENYFYDKKMARLKKLLQHGNFELAKFVLNAKYQLHRKIFLVRLGLKVARKDFTSEEKAYYNLTEAFDLAFDDMIIQLRKLESRIHNT